MLENDFTNTDSNVASGSRNTHLSPSFEIFDLEDESHPTPNGHVNSTQVTSGSGSGSGEKLKHRSKPTRSMINPQATHLKQHPERGNGVFATHPIAPGSIIEESPVLIITKEQWEEGKMDDCILGEYGFCWRGGGMGIGLGSGKIFPVNDKKVQDVNPGSGSWSTKPKPDDDQVRLVTELASLFNHSSSPNVNYVRDFEKSVIRFTASRAIQPGEELCICYAADESKLWFINSDEKRQRSEGSEEETVIFPPEELVELLDGEADEERRAAEEKRIARQKRLEMMKGVPREAGRREMKKAKFFEKRKAAQEAEEAKLNGIEPKVIAPTPIRPPPSASTSASSTPSRINTPLYPAIPERTVESPSLPPPLHSTKGKSRHEHDGPVILTPELEWDDQTSAEGEEEWAGIERIKGFTEREEDEALENDSALSKYFSLDLEEIADEQWMFGWSMSMNPLLFGKYCDSLKKDYGLSPN
jgi:tRNA-specific adenosine deaminase 3